MKAQDLLKLKVDHKYRFNLNDGTTLVRRGSWLLGTKDGYYCLDERKCELLKSVDDA